jgi:hypothetical protein
MTDQMPSSVRKSWLPIALVALSIALGAPAVSAQTGENAASWREVAIDPIMNAVHTLEARLSSIETSMAQFADSFTTQQITTRQLCVSDEAGAQTCLTKAQLDALLARMTQAAVDPSPAAVEPTTAVAETPAVAAEPPVAAAVEPVPVDSDAKPSASIDAQPEEAVVAAVPVSEQGAGSKEEQSADLEPAVGGTTIVSAPEPATIPAEAVPQEDSPRDEAPATTGSITSEPSGSALVSHPEGEISGPETASANE